MTDKGSLPPFAEQVRQAAAQLGSWHQVKGSGDSGQNGDALSTVQNVSLYSSFLSERLNPETCARRAMEGAIEEARREPWRRMTDAVHFCRTKGLL